MYNLKLALYITKNTGLSIKKSNKILNIILKEIQQEYLSEQHIIFL
ncbi:hypothetical protein [Candidatus Portiera aleyrodidarum]|nr:hypothetical protein [Candidatus Portiera aleyrodidarum]